MRYGSNPLKGETITARLAFSLAEDLNVEDILVEGDSLMLVDQILKTDCILDWCIEGEVITIRKLLVEHVNWKLAWTPRDVNCMAHSLAKWGLDSEKCARYSSRRCAACYVNCDDSAILGRAACLKPQEEFAILLSNLGIS